MPRVLLLVNPHSRRGGSDLAVVYRRFHEAGWEIIQAPARSPEDTSAVIREHCDRVAIIVVGGGDGTLSKAAPGLCDCRLPFGLLPLGTANDLAHTLGIPDDLEQATEVILAGRSRPIDLGRVNGVPFFNAASIGLAVAVTHQVTARDKHRYGIFGYLWALWRAWHGNRPFRADIVADGKRSQLRTLQITVGNGRQHGGGLLIDQEAGLSDSRLHLYALCSRPWWRLLKVAAALRLGRAGADPDVFRASGKRIHISTRATHQIATDGELSTWTPADFEVEPNALRVFVPDASGTGEVGRAA